MAKLELPENLRDSTASLGNETGGPFITISRQPGCWGFSLGLLLQELLNDLAPEGLNWRVYQKEILERLAEETALDVETLEERRVNKPSILADFLHTFSQKRLPSGFEVRNRVTSIIRSEAAKGYAIFIGQGSAGATADMATGMAIRLEAPDEWRVKQVAFRDGLTIAQARHCLTVMEQEHQYLKRIYEMRFPRKPPFHIMFDCSIFTLAHIAQQIVYAMKLRKMV